MKQLIKNLKKEAREEFDRKYTYVDSEFFPNKPISSRYSLKEMRSHQDKLIEKAVKATLEEVIGEEKTKECCCGELLDESDSGYHYGRDDERCGIFIGNLRGSSLESEKVEGYNAKRQEIIDKLNEL